MALLEKLKDSSLPLKSLFTWSLIINTLFITIGLLSTIILPPEIPLFFGMPKDANQLASSYFIILPSLIALFFTVVNLLLAIKLHGQYIKKALAFTSISVTVLSVIAVYKIIFLVGSF